MNATLSRLICTVTVHFTYFNVALEHTVQYWLYVQPFVSENVWHGDFVFIHCIFILWKQHQSNALLKGSIITPKL